MVAPVLPPIFLPIAVPATLPRALAAATRVVLSACAVTVNIDATARDVLIKRAFNFMVHSMSKFVWTVVINSMKQM